jgi:hypothetical protein
MIYRKSAAVPSLASAERGLIAHILHLDNSVFAQARHRFLLENEMPPFPERLKRALVSNTRAVSAVLATPDVAPPAEKPIQETDRLIRVRDPLPVLNRVAADVPTIPASESPISFRHSLGVVGYLFQYTGVSSSFSWVPSLYRFCRS